MSGNVWNPDQRNYPDALNAHKKKTDYSPFEIKHPDNALNQEYLDAGAADDRERPLCFGVHQGIACRRLVRRGTRYCWEGKGDG